MMTEAQRKYMHARRRVKSTMLDPVTELLKATDSAVEEARAAAERSERLLAEMRPLWAQGYTSDSLAAQATGNALAEIWAALGVKNQTAAMVRLRELLGSAA